jgi:alkyl hydroperoxide reductase subunit AhpC
MCRRRCPQSHPPPYHTACTAAIVNGEVKEVSLEEYKGKYVILFFYPKDFT